MTAAECLRTSVLFTGLSPGQSDRLAAVARERKTAAGEVIFRIGGSTDTLHIICEGSVELTFPLMVMGETKEVRFQTLEPGGALAWSALVPPHILTMSARAANEVTLASFSRGDLLKVWGDEPDMGLVVMSNLAKVISTRLATSQALWVREVQRHVTQLYG